MELSKEELPIQHILPANKVCQLLFEELALVHIVETVQKSNRQTESLQGRLF